MIGHEIGHGFDDQGAQYDGAGNLSDWWTARRQGAPSRRSRKALIAQYDGFEPRDLPGEHVNGALTVGENIGDLGGLTIALKAYLDRPRRRRRRSRTPQKLFFNWAYCWRTKRRKELDAAVPHHRPAQPAGVPRQHRAQPRRVPRGVRHPARRRPLARARGARPHLVTRPSAEHGQAAYRLRFDWGLDRRPGPGRRRATGRRRGRRRRAVLHDHALVAVERGIAVYPYPWAAADAPAYAAARGATLARGRRAGLAAGSVSLSPASFDGRDRHRAGGAAVAERLGDLLRAGRAGRDGRGRLPAQRGRGRRAGCARPTGRDRRWWLPASAGRTASCDRRSRTCGVPVPCWPRWAPDGASPEARTAAAAYDAVRGRPRRPRCRRVPAVGSWSRPASPRDVEIAAAVRRQRRRAGAARRGVRRRLAISGGAHASRVVAAQLGDVFPGGPVHDPRRRQCRAWICSTRTASWVARSKSPVTSGRRWTSRNMSWSCRIQMTSLSVCEHAFSQGRGRGQVDVADALHRAGRGRTRACVTTSPRCSPCIRISHASLVA